MRERHNLARTEQKTSVICGYRSFNRVYDLFRDFVEAHFVAQHFEIMNNAGFPRIRRRASASALGIEMQEIEDWQCCGAVYPTARDEIANKLSAVRALSEMFSL